MLWTGQRRDGTAQLSAARRHAACRAGSHGGQLLDQLAALGPHRAGGQADAAGLDRARGYALHDQGADNDALVGQQLAILQRHLGCRARALRDAAVSPPAAPHSRMCAGQTLCASRPWRRQQCPCWPSACSPHAPPQLPCRCPVHGSEVRQHLGSITCLLRKRAAHRRCCCGTASGAPCPSLHTMIEEHRKPARQAGRTSSPSL